MPLQVLQHILGFRAAWLFGGAILALAIAALSRRLRLLSPSGALAATLVGTVVFGLGGWHKSIALIVFFAGSNLVGRWRRQRKERLGFEKGGERDAGQVLANGGVAAFAVLVAAAITHSAPILSIAFYGALAEAAADTWATEVGSASGVVPILITSLRRAAPGRSGAVSIPGTLAAVAGAALIAMAGLLLGDLSGIGACCVTFAGLAGSLADSVMGATWQGLYRDPMRGDGLTEKRSRTAVLASGYAWVNNDMVNFAATAVSAVIAAALMR